MMLMILKDRYCGAYSGGKWLVIENYCELLTPKELEWLNNHIKSTDEFYESLSAKWKEQKLPRDNRLDSYNTRFDAVEKTLQGSDCYAQCNFKLMPWCKAVNDVSEFVDKISPFNKIYSENTKFWQNVYKAEND